MIPRRVALFIGLTVCFIAVSVTRADTPATKPVPTTAPTAYTRTSDIVYGRSFGAALVLDMLKPKTEPNRAAVIVIISGGWVSAHEIIDSPFFGAFINPYITRGYTVFTVCHACQPKFQVNEIVENINRAVRFIRFHAKDYGIDENRFGVTGGSAGGHLSLMQGLSPKQPLADAKDPVDRVSSKVQAVACFFPPSDFLNWGAEGKNVLDEPNMVPFLPAMDFRELDQKTHLWEHLDRKKVEVIEKEISPAYFTSVDDPPTLIIHGDKDTLVPIQQAQLVIDKLKAASVPAELIIRPGQGHGWMNIAPDIEEFAKWFDKYLLKESK